MARRATLRLAFCVPIPLLRSASPLLRSLRQSRTHSTPLRATTLRASSSSTTRSVPSPTSVPPASHPPPFSVPTFQDAIRLLQEYWLSRGCIVWHPYNVEVGAGTMNPATFLRVLGPEPWSVAYDEPSLRPDDSRYGENPNRLQRHTQFQVIIKPAPECAQELVVASYRALGIDTAKHDVRFVEDNWQSPALGAWGLGWEVWLDGMEVTQFTYFQQAGGVPLESVAVEITYGLERIMMALQGKTHFKDIVFAPGVTYGDVFMQNEVEMSKYNLCSADIKRNAMLFDEYEAEALQLLEAGLPVPAYNYLLKASHTFNILDARGAVGVTERARFFQRMRNLARNVAMLWTQRRKELGFPLLSAAPSMNAALQEDSMRQRIPNTAPHAPAAPSPLGATEQFVLEVGMEELPPEDLSAMITQMKTLFESVLSKASLNFDRLQVSGTPRRVCVLAHNLQTRQADITQHVRGPPLRIAMDENDQLTRAALGFLRKHGIDNVDLAEYSFENGYMYATVKTKGLSTVDVLAEAIPSEILAKLTFGKTMRWNATDVAFSRPVRWLLCMLGSHVVPFEFSAVNSGNASRSLRGSDGFASLVTLDLASAYPLVMRKNQVIISGQERLQLVLSRASQLAEEIGGCVSPDALSGGLLDEVTCLVENPIPILGRFDESFLSLPKEVLVTVMKKHQRYIPVEDKSTGALMNAFIAVANGDTNLVDLDIIRAGNESVLRARYADASFFYENDTKGKRLADFVPLLSELAFQESLGSMLDKTERICELVKGVSEAMNLNHHESAVADSAAKLCKADLATSMVVEMTSLAGAMGRHYTRKSGEVSGAVSEAVFDAALPRFSGDVLPLSMAGAAVSIADRLDSLTALFGIGLAPKATADPFALRRAALGIIQTLIERKIYLDLAPLVDAASEALIASSANGNFDVKNSQEVLGFIEKRLEGVLLEGSCGIEVRPDVVKAVLGVSTNARNPFAAYEAAISLQEAIRDSPSVVRDAVDAHSRSARLLKSLKGIDSESLASYKVDRSLLDLEEEYALLEALDAARAKVFGVHSSIRERLCAVAETKVYVDAFFDNVYVNTDDERVRRNRQALSAQLVLLTSSCVDLSLLQM